MWVVEVVLWDYHAIRSRREYLDVMFGYSLKWINLVDLLWWLLKKKTRTDISMLFYLTNRLNLIDSSSCVSVWVWSTAPCKLLLLVSSRSNIQLPEVYVLRSIKGHQLLQVLTAAQMYACCCFLCIWLRVAAVAAGEPMCEKMEPVPTFSCIDRVIDWTWIVRLKSKRAVAL